MYYLCIRLQINISVLFCSVLFCSVSPGGGAFAILSRPRGLGISIPRGEPRAFDTRVFERQIRLSGRTRPLPKTGLSIRD